MKLEIVEAFEIEGGWWAHAVQVTLPDETFNTLYIAPKRFLRPPTYYKKQVLAWLAQGKPKETFAEIAHDTTCGIQNTGKCDCNPEITALGHD
jgi:hypothetical protein